MSVFHRVDDVSEMPAAKFFPFAERLPAYGGIVAHRLAELHELDQEAPPVASSRGGARPADQVETVPLEVANAHFGFAGDGMQFPSTFRQVKRKRKKVTDGV